MILTVALLLLASALGGGCLADWMAERRHQRSLDEEIASAFQRGKELGEKNAKHHNRTYIRYVNVDRLTPEQVMPGPFVKERGE